MVSLQMRWVLPQDYVLTTTAITLCSGVVQFVAKFAIQSKMMMDAISAVVADVKAVRAGYWLLVCC